MKTLFNLPAEITKTGKLKFNQNEMDHILDGLKYSNTRKIRILICEDFDDMTTKQLSYYHGILLKDVVSAYESIGEYITEKEVDKIMRSMFLLQYETHIKTGQKIRIIRTLNSESKSFPDTKEISVFFENICRYCAENMNYMIHLPDDIKDIQLDFNRT